MRFHALWSVSALASIVLGAHGEVLAQAAPLAAGQVSGAELQAWLDADGLAVGGINLNNGCHFMARNKGASRHLAVFCGNDSAPWVVKGEGKVVGDKWCAKFIYPDGSGVDRCEQFFKIGDNKYETRLEGVVIHHLYRLVP